MIEFCLVDIAIRDAILAQDEIFLPISSTPIVSKSVMHRDGYPRYSLLWRPWHIRVSVSPCIRICARTSNDQAAAYARSLFSAMAAASKPVQNYQRTASSGCCRWMLPLSDPSNCLSSFVHCSQPPESDRQRRRTGVLMYRFHVSDQYVVAFWCRWQQCQTIVSVRYEDSATPMAVPFSQNVS